MKTVAWPREGAEERRIGSVKHEYEYHKLLRNVVTNPILPLSTKYLKSWAYWKIAVEFEANLGYRMGSRSDEP